MPEDNPAPTASAFQDLILELMVANQYLQEINQHSFRTAEYLGTIAQSVTGTPLVATIEPQHTEAAPLVANAEPQSMRESVASLNWLIGIQESLLLETTKGLGQIHSTLVGIDRGLEVIIDIMAGNRLQALEDKKEKRTDGLVPSVAKSKTSKLDSSGLGFLGTIAAITVAITAFLVGVVAGIKAMLGIALVKIIGLINTLFTKSLNTYIGRQMVAFGTAITKSITTGLNSVLEAFKNTKGFRTIRVHILRFMSGLKQLLLTTVDKINNIFRTIKASIFLFLRGDIMTELKALFPILKSVQTWVTTIFKSVTVFGKYMGRIAAVFFKIGKAFSFLTGPIGIAIGIIASVVEAIMDAVESFKETGDLAEAVRVGITGLINSFSGGILDLIKDATSWIAGALGFKEAEKALDSFSFSTIIEAFVGRIFKWIKGIFESLAGNFSDIFKDIGKAFTSGNVFDFSIELIRGVLKTLVALPFDIVKNSIASLMGILGATSAEDWLRSFSFQKMHGGTHTETIGEQKTSGRNIFEEGGDLLVAKKLKEAKAKEKKEIEANAKKKENELKAQKDKDPISQFYDALMQAYKEAYDARGETGMLPAAQAALKLDSAAIASSSTAGATILATAVENKEMLAAQAASNNQQIIQATPPARRAQTNVTNNNQSVSYNNTPDRTDRAVSGWMSPYGFGAR